MLPAGHILQQRFLIERVLGQGGMGAVYLARHLTLAQRSMAIKEMTVDIADPERRGQAVAQFLKEAQILAGLEHPNLVRVQDFFEEEGKQYLVMDYIDGKNLEDVMIAADTFLPTDRVVAWGRQMADVLQYLHTRQPPVLFRDLKPSNILLDGRGQIRLVDFGIARVLDPSSQTSTFIHGAGTVGFAPIEQYTGSTDPRTDIYALGATLYTLLTRVIPPMSIAMMSGEARLTPPRAVNPGLSPALEACLLKMLALQRENRYASAAEVATALEAAMRPDQPAVPCSHCGQPLMAGAQFCGECGQRVGAPAVLPSVSTIKPPAVSEATQPVQNRPSAPLPATEPQSANWRLPDQIGPPSPKWSALPPEAPPPVRRRRTRWGWPVIGLGVFLAFQALKENQKPPLDLRRASASAVVATSPPEVQTTSPPVIPSATSTAPATPWSPPPHSPSPRVLTDKEWRATLEPSYHAQEQALMGKDVARYMNTLSPRCVFKFKREPPRNFFFMRARTQWLLKWSTIELLTHHIEGVKPEGTDKVVFKVRNHMVLSYRDLTGPHVNVMDGTGWDTWQRGMHGWQQVEFDEEKTTTTRDGRRL